MSDLFLSYSAKDRTSALALVEELRANGYSVWIDKGGVAGASNWRGEIVQAINACSTVLVLVSPNSITSDNVSREVHLASEKKKNILPIILERAQLPAPLEYSLAGIQHVHYHDKPSILDALGRLHGRPIGTLPAVTQPKQEEGEIRVAVMPFDDLSPEHDNQWFADGMMDELIGTLRYLEHIKVPGRWDVLHYRDHRLRARDIARELSVRYLIEGSVRKAGGKIRISSSLVDAERSEQLWAGKFDGSFDNVFDFQESVSKQITEALKLQLSPKEEAKLEEQPTQNAEAYELYLRGREQQYLLTKEGYEKALELYEKAVKLDPKFAKAYVAIASVCNTYYREYSRDPKWLKRSELNVELAKAISGETGETLWVQGLGEWIRGNNAQAIYFLKEASKMDPKGHNVNNALGSIYMTIGEYNSAADSFKKEIEVHETPLDYFNLLIALNALGDNDKMKETALIAMPVFERHLIRHPADRSAKFQFAAVLHRAGEMREARELADQLSSDDSLSGNSLYNLGCLYDNLGEPRFYNEFLLKAIEKGYREIEQTRNYEFTTKDPECEAEFRKLVAELEAIVGEETSRKEEVETEA